MCHNCVFCYRSAPELGNNSKDGQLRKTNSQPHPSRGSNSAQCSVKGRNQDDAHKHFRCKSVPTPLNEVVDQNKDRNTGSDAGSRITLQESSCPSSPLECSKNLNFEDGKKLSSSNFSESAEGSLLKSKKTDLSTATKSKTDSGGGPKDASYANSLDLEQDSVPPTKCNDNGTEGLENEQNSVS